MQSPADPVAPSGAPPYGPQPYWAPPRRAPGNQVLVIIGVVVGLIVLFGFVMVALAFPFGGSSFMFAFMAPLCIVFLIIIVFAVLAATGALRRSNLPPPPPIQGPMVPAGTQGPIALSCPNCGAPPVNVDRFGVATCTYCATRFIVR
ncbi:MAG: hypothetical protein E6K17_01690 [Methanobacteriota archaeon]|nr:MAG: hypothetical protein E6K17_01690 [Euryarchaeota archaeon]